MFATRRDRRPRRCRRYRPFVDELQARIAPSGVWDGVEGGTTDSTTTTTTTTRTTRSDAELEQALRDMEDSLESDGVGV